MTLTVEELEARWNACADRSNQWSELGLDEIVAFAQEECARMMADMASNMAAERERLRNLLRLVADEPNIDKARALADAELHGPNDRGVAQTPALPK